MRLAPWFFAGFCCTTALAAPGPVPPPGEATAIAAPAILQRVARAHPRLLVSPGSFDTLKADIAADPRLQTWRTALLDQALRVLSQPVSRYEIPDGLRLLATSRRVLDRTYTLALAYRLTGDSQWLDRLGQELEAAAAFPDWNPKHFLDTAEMTHAFAIAYDWLYEDWTAERRALLRTALVEKGLRRGVEAFRGGTAFSWWTRSEHNWNQVCNGGIGMGALALAHEEPALAGEFLAAALQSLPRALRHYAPDGAWSEGPGYWNYATAYTVVFLAALESACGTDFGLGATPGVSEAGWFPLYITGPLNRTFNYADGGDGLPRSPELFWLARRFHQPAFANWQRRHAAPEALDLLWASRSPPDPAAAPPPLDRHFRDADVVTFRSAWDDPRAVFVGFKAGDNKANHSNLDLGTFVLDALGERWALDLGADDYNLPGYFGAQRWSYYRLRAEGHNTLVINPGQAPDQDPKAAGSVLRYHATPDRAFATLDLTPAYAPNARRVHRGIALVNRQRLVVQDEVETAHPAGVWWFLHTRAQITLAADGAAADLALGNQRLLARIVSPADARFTVAEARPLPTSPQPEKQHPNDGIRKLSIRQDGVRELRLVVELLPGVTAPGAAPTPGPVRALHEW